MQAQTAAVGSGSGGSRGSGSGSGYTQAITKTAQSKPKTSGIAGTAAAVTALNGATAALRAKQQTTGGSSGGVGTGMPVR